MELLARHSEGVIVLTGCLQSRFCRRLVEERARRRPRPPRRPDPGLRPRPGLLRGAEERHRRAGQGERGDRPLRPRAEAGRWSPPPTSTTCGARTSNNHAALLCVQTKSTLEAPKMSFDTNEFYIKSSEEMIESFAEWPEAVPTSLEIAERCSLNIELGSLLLPQLPDRGRLRAGGDAAPDRRRGAARPLRRPAAGRGGRADGVRARGDRGDGLLLLLPDRLGLRPLRQGKRRRRRARPWLRRRLDRLLRAQDHRPRPALGGPDLRALPQPRA